MDKPRAGCMLLGKHVITIDQGTDPGETNMLIKSGDVEVNFYIDDDGSLCVTHSSDLTNVTEVLSRLPVPKNGD